MSRNNGGSAIAQLFGIVLKFIVIFFMLIAQAGELIFKAFSNVCKHILED